MAFVPANSTQQPLAEIGRGFETELLIRAAGVERAARLTVRLAVIPDDFALVADQFGNGLGQFADADLEAGADIDRLGLS